MKKFHYIHSLSSTTINNDIVLKFFPEHIKKILLSDNKYPIIESIGYYDLFVCILPVIDEKNYFALIESDIVI